eukprot:687939_1
MLTKLTKAIQFRHLLSQLTDEERISFLSVMLNDHVDVIISGLFFHFIQSNDSEVLNDVNNSVSNIIQQRKEKPKLECATNIKLDQFPRDIIGYTASFLNQWDYIHFSVSMRNRSIYLGCNTPNSLQELELRNARSVDYSHIRLNAFPSTITLAIDPIKANDLELFGEPVFPKVNTLRLNAHGGSSWVQDFLDMNIVNYDTVTRLECHEFGSEGPEMELDVLLNLLKQFPNLKHLALDTVYLEEPDTEDDIATLCDLCPDIIGLHLNDICFEINDLIPRLSPKLKYLTLPVDEVKGDARNLGTATFHELEEVCITMPTHQNVINVLKSSLHLKKICLMGLDFFMNPEQIKDTMKNVMQCPHVTCMQFEIRHKNFICMMEGIDDGLYVIEAKQRKELKIEIFILNSATNDGGHTTERFVLAVERVVKQLEMSAIKDFMFVFQFVGKYEQMKAVFQHLRDASTVSGSTETFELEDKFAIYNKNCRINGFADTICGESPYLD